MNESSLIPEGKLRPFLLSGSSEVRVTATAKKSVFCSRTLQQNRWVQASRSWTWALELKDSVPLHNPPHNKSTFRLSSHQLFSVCSPIVTLSSSPKMKTCRDPARQQIIRLWMFLFKNVGLFDRQKGDDTPPSIYSQIMYPWIEVPQSRPSL